jgi:hypothetical protein
MDYYNYKQERNDYIRRLPTTALLYILIGRKNVSGLLIIIQFEMRGIKAAVVIRE